MPSSFWGRKPPPTLFLATLVPVRTRPQTALPGPRPDIPCPVETAFRAVATDRSPPGLPSRRTSHVRLVSRSAFQRPVDQQTSVRSSVFCFSLRLAVERSNGGRKTERRVSPQTTFSWHGTCNARVFLFLGAGRQHPAQAKARRRPRGRLPPMALADRRTVQQNSRTKGETKVAPPERRSNRQTPATARNANPPWQAVYREANRAVGRGPSFHPPTGVRNCGLLFSESTGSRLGDRRSTRRSVFRLPWHVSCTDQRSASRPAVGQRNGGWQAVYSVHPAITVFSNQAHRWVPRRQGGRGTRRHPIPLE